LDFSLLKGKTTYTYIQTRSSPWTFLFGCNKHQITALTIANNLPKFINSHLPQPSFETPKSAR
jgi:hypothetical protein